MTSAPAPPSAIATARPMPELPPVTRAFWPARIRRSSQDGMTTGGRFSSATVLISDLLGFGLFALAAARLQQLGDRAGPAGLVRGADAAAVVAVEVFVEQHVVPEVRIVLQFRMRAERRAPAVLVAQENATETTRERLGDLLDRDEVAGPGRALDLE